MSSHISPKHDAEESSLFFFTLVVVTLFVFKWKTLAWTCLGTIITLAIYPATNHPNRARKYDAEDLDEKENVERIKTRLRQLTDNVDSLSLHEKVYLNQDTIRSRKAEIIKCLRMLAESYCQKCSKRGLGNSVPRSDKDDLTTNLDEDIDMIGVKCQEVGYNLLGGPFANFDDVASAIISLLALTAKNSEVQKLYHLESNRFDIERPIRCLTMALDRAIDDANATNESLSEDFVHKREQLQADIQRKGCLLLGALSDTNTKSLANMVAERGGFEIIFKAVDWYRFHENVCKWGLWAIFILTNENQTNKFLFISLDGTPRIIQILRNCPDSIDVARHGIAILFDVLRDQNVEDDKDYDAKATKIDIWKVRQSAVNAGLHDVILGSMEAFPDSSDIIMMGQELLRGTGYIGVTGFLSPIVEN